MALCPENIVRIDACSLGRMRTISNLSKRNFPRDSRLCFLKNLGRDNRLYEKFGLSGFNDQYFPELFNTEDRFGTSGIDGGGLRLIEYNHGCERDVWSTRTRYAVELKQVRN